MPESLGQAAVGVARQARVRPQLLQARPHAPLQIDAAGLVEAVERGRVGDLLKQAGGAPGEAPPDERELFGVGEA